MQASPERVLYTIALYTGTGIEEPDVLATIDVRPNSLTDVR
jgi:selenium-binding protein 1